MVGKAAEKESISLEARYRKKALKALDRCTFCGDCVRNCVVSRHLPLRDTSPEKVMENVALFLRRGVMSDEAYFKAFGCASCGRCTESCPEGIDAQQIFEAARADMVRRGRVPDASRSVEKVSAFWRLLSALQLGPSEMRWLWKVPRNPPRSETVVFLGCTTPAFPHFAFAFLDVLEMLGVEHVALAGGELCCGFPHFPASGLIWRMEEKGAELVSGLEAFSPDRVVLLCAGCYRQFTQLYPDFLDHDFEVLHYSQFLRERLRDCDTLGPLRRRVVLNESCMMKQTRLGESVLDLLSLIPGLQLSRGPDLCCGGTPKLAFPQASREMEPLFSRELLRTVEDEHAEGVVNFCQLCEMAMYPHVGSSPVDLLNVPGLVCESMGGPAYDSILRQYLAAGSVDNIIQETAGNLRANGLSEDEVRGILRAVFQGPP